MDTNIGVLCSAHADAMPQTMEVNGVKHVKVRFPIPGLPNSTENMWVIVSDFSDDYGTLDNDPACVDYVKCGDHIVFYVRPGDDEWRRLFAAKKHIVRVWSYRRKAHDDIWDKIDAAASQEGLTGSYIVRNIARGVKPGTKTRMWFADVEVFPKK